jgi:outer membrane receptor protein involved in Fe transport
MRAFRTATAAVLTGFFSMGAPAAELAASDATPPGANAGLEEIVVTATRHEENLSKVPISITALSQDTMDNKGIRDFADIARFTPGVTIDRTGSNTITIRGIGSSGGAGTTGIYIDDTPIQIRALSQGPVDALPKTFDLDRVEVLRGPQGTLFGAGSEGGTVRYIMTQPSLTKFSDYERAEVAYTEGGAPSYEAGAAFGGPIVNDTLGFRVSAWYRRDGGWIDHIEPTTLQLLDGNSNHTETTALRAALTWAPASGVKITPSIFWQERNANDIDHYWPIYSNPNDNRYVSADPSRSPAPDRFALPVLAISADLGPVQLLSNSSYYRRRDLTNYDGTQLTLDYTQIFSWSQDANGKFHNSLCAPQGYNCYPLIDGHGIHLPAALADYRAPGSVTNNQDNYTQELRVQSSDPTARVVWTAGAFFSVNRTYSLSAVSDPMVDALYEYAYGTTIAALYGAATNPDGSTYLPRGDSYFNELTSHERQIAGFGEAVWSLTDQWKLTTGFRYSKLLFSFNSLADGPYNGGPGLASGSENAKPFTKRVGLSFQADPNNLFYATFSTGFRGGGSNAAVPQSVCADGLAQLGLTNAPASYDPDTVKSYEIGSKNNFGNRVRIGASVYYIQWNGIQQQVAVPICGVDYIANLGSAVSKGGDLQADFAVTEGLTVETAIGYTDAYYSKSSFPGPKATTPVSSEGDAVTGQGQNGLGGNPAAPWTFSVGAEYKFRLFDRNSFVRLDAEHQTKNNRLTAAADPTTAQYTDCTQLSGVVSSCYAAPPAFTFVSMRAGMDFAGWNVAAFVDNLLDRHPLLSTSYYGRDPYGPQPAIPPLADAYTLRPRTFGITVTHRQ